MITKAIVEEIISPYQVKVRIPILDRAEGSVMSTSKEDLNIATICSLPNCYMNLQVGDIVFVGFEDNTYYKAVVLGYLCREATNYSFPDITLNNLIVKGESSLPAQTRIGDVNDIEISRLSGVSENIQKQIDSIKDTLEVVLGRLEKGGI